ncbi:MAG: 30S ribosomal protein S13 [Candidatus Pacebacteria bacterium]|nr:30S ribosomal protein S13 [Candidatus Paceibacterota bacterium]
MRISGITIPDEKRLEIGLTVLYGVGRSLAHKILDDAKVDYGKKSKDLSTDEEKKIRDIVEGHKLEGNLKREISGNIKRLIDIKSYRGSRHTKNLPCRGQRTRTNARTLRGKKKTMGSGRNKEKK